MADPRVLDARTAMEVRNPVITEHQVCAPGYVAKDYPSGLPPIVRLLRNEPAVFVDRPSARPGDEFACMCMLLNPGSCC